MELSFRKLGLWVGELSLAEAGREGRRATTERNRNRACLQGSLRRTPRRVSRSIRGTQEFLSIRSASVERAGRLPGAFVLEGFLTDSSILKERGVGKDRQHRTRVTDTGNRKSLSPAWQGRGWASSPEAQTSNSSAEEDFMFCDL